MSEDRRVTVHNIETIESDDTEDDRGQMNSNVLLWMHKDKIIITILKWFASMMGNIKIKIYHWKATYWTAIIWNETYSMLVYVDQDNCKSHPKSLCHFCLKIIRKVELIFLSTEL